MGYNGKLPGKDEVARLIIEALRQDKKDVVINAEFQAEIDQASFEKAEKQIDKLNKDVEVDINTSKAEKQLENLLEALTNIQGKIKSMSGTDIGFKGLHNVTKQYEALKQEIYEVADAVGKNNQAFIQSQKIIRDTERALQQLSITKKKTSTSQRSSKKKTGTTVETDVTTSNYEGQAGAVKDVVQATHELADVSKQEIDQVKDKVDDAKEAYKSLGDVIGETKNKMVGVKSAEDLEIIKKENSALEDKLELLQDIAEQYANIISLRDRNRYEELNQKDMNDGLTAREEERYWELGEAIDEADRQLEEFGATYSRIILKLGNGKKIQILPDDAGLKKLDKIANEYYQGEYNGIEIEDVIFERIQATTDAMLDQGKVVETIVESQVGDNQKLISSYEDLLNVIKKTIEISKQIKPTVSSEYAQIDRDMDYTDYVHDQSEIIAQIKASYQNVKNIKASQKQGLSVYKHVYDDGSDTERYIDADTLGKAEATLRGYIYKAVEQFGYTIADVANDFTAKQIRTFVAKQIEHYLTSSAADDAYRLDAKAFNEPLEEAIAKVIADIVALIPEADKSSAQTILDTLMGRPNAVNRYTLSRETNKLGGYIGLPTPDSEIQANAKKIESYEELCEILERYHQLMRENIIYGGMDSPGLDEAQEKELITIRSRLTAMGGQDVWKLAEFGEFKDVDKLAGVLGIQIPQVVTVATEANEQLIESNKQVQESAKETTDAIKKQGEAVKEYYKSELPDKTIKHLTKGTDINSLLSQFSIGKDDRSAIQAEFAHLVDIIYDIIVNANSSEEAYTEMTSAQAAIESMIVSLGALKADRIQLYDDFRNFMKGIQISYDESTKAEFGDEWKSMIKKFGMGKYKVLTKDSSARGADQLYQELLELFPGLFDDKIINEKDQLKKILDVLQTARDNSKTNWSGLTPDAIDYVHDVLNDAIAIISANALTPMGSGSSNVSAEEIIAREIGEALEQLRSAQNNETTLFSLKGVFEGEDLVEEAQKMVETIAEASNLSLGKFVVKDDIIKVQLYNEELKVTVDQLYKLRAAKEDADSAQLELVSQSFSQNVKALNENNFDVEGVQQRALAAIEKVRSSLHGLEYDLTSLEDAAKNISSQDDFVKFNNQLKAAQDNIQAIKNSTVSKNSMNPLANMQRDMQNASIEIETMRLKLEKFGDIQGVAEARKMLEEMAEAVKQYNSATDAEGQKNAYNNYSNIRSSFKAQTEYINAAKSLHDSQESAQKQTDPIKNQYQTILDLVNKINAANERMIKFQSMDGGSGLLTKQIAAEQQKKLEAVEKLKAVMEQLNVGNILGADHYSLPDDVQSIGADYSQIAAFINDAGVQASLSTKEIEKLVAALVKAGDIDLSMLSEAFNSTSIKERAKQTAYENRYFADKTSVTADASGNVQLNINDIERLGTASTSTKEKLESMAQAIAKNSEGAVALTKSFSQGADGIARLDFSVFDKSTNSMRNFTIELGTTTGKIAAYETTINKSLANIKSAEKQMSSIGDLLGRLEVSGVNTKGANAPASITELLNLYNQLESVVKGETTDNDIISKLLNKSKLTQAEVEKLYRQMLQLQDAVDSDKAVSLGIGNPNGDVYQQLVENTKRVIGANQNATLEFGRFDAATNTLNASLVHANGTVENFQVHMDQLSGQMTSQQVGVNKLTTSWDRFKTGVSQAGKHLMTALVGYNAFFKVVSEVRKGIGYVKDIDLALTELKKVTNETEESYRKFLNTAAGTAGNIGSTVSDFTEATANFARLGYSMEESSKMAETAIVYKNVADGLDTVEESTDSIISTMKAFGIESSDTMGIIDRFNEVGNNFAITSAGIGEALQRSASALYAGGNTIDESIALVTAANSVIQNPEQVGTALKTLTLRLRGAKVELEEAGLETENMAESTSTLQAKLKALTHGKVDIMLDADTFKNTTQILREMSAVWEEMTDIEQAGALELMGGKRQANILASLITNFKTVEDVIQTSMNSSGSAIAENEKYLDSIQGRMDQFTNSLQAFWNNMLDSDVIKGFVEFGTDAIKFLDTVPGKLVAIAVALGAFSQSKGISMYNLIPDIKNRVADYAAATTQLEALNKQYRATRTLFGKFEVTSGVNLHNQDGTWNTDALTSYANAIKGLSANEQANLLIKQGLNREQIKEVMLRAGVEDKVIQETLSKKNLATTTMSLRNQTVAQILTTEMATDASQKAAIAAYLEANGHKKLTKALVEEMYAKELISQEKYTELMQSFNISWGSTIKSIAQSPTVIMMAATALATWINSWKTATDKAKEFKEEYDELQSSISEAEGERESITTELQEVQDQIDELNKKDKLTIADSEQLTTLRKQSDELKHQQNLYDKILDAREYQEDVKSLQAINNMLKTSAAGQQKAAEKSAKTWKIVVGAVGAAAAAVGAIWTGGTSAAAIPSILAWAAGGAAVGAAIGNKAGYAIGMSRHEAGDSILEWYESYEQAIKTAEQKASDAEATYMSKMTDKNYKKWREKEDYVTTLKKEMYDGLTELNGYISNLEYDDNTRAVIDGYNDVMAQIHVKDMDGDITAQLSLVQSLEDEYKALSRGVDEHGNNIALTADEYSRYQSIITQVLACNTGLTQSFDSNGNAILRTSNAQFTYNQMIEESIRLLKQQRKAAATALVGDTELTTWYTDYKSTYTNGVEVNNDAKPATGTIYDEEGDLKQYWDTYDSEDVIRQLIYDAEGYESEGWWANFWGTSDTDLIVKNAELIKKNREDLAARFQTYLEANGMSEGDAQQYTEAYFKWVDEIINQIDSKTEAAEQEIKNRLYNVPLLSDQYDNLSGSQLEFVNAYIAGLQDLTNKSEDEILQIKQNILTLMNDISNDKNMQDAIDELMALDPSSMPVGAYEKKFNELWEKIYPEEDTQEEKNQNPLYQQLFPDQSQIDIWTKDVKSKLEASSRGMVDSLSKTDLQIAWNLLPELDEGITFQELKEQISEVRAGIDGPIVQTYSTLTEAVANFNEIAQQTSEIVTDNTKVTQEYKDSLVALGISEEELAVCFDATNSLVVTNAKKLNQLVNSAKKNTAQNISLAKSQATLRYYELYKQMAGYVTAEGKVTQGTVKQIVALHEEMNALEKTIAQYSRLETQLLGVSNAYEKFAQAQEMDSDTDYINSVEGMISALGEAFNTAELGTESAQAAIAGLVPESVYKDLDTVDEKMSAIYDYFKEGKLSQYFDITFDDDGNIESAEMKLGNLRKFIEDGLAGVNGASVFEGTDWQHFEFSDTFLSGLKDADDKLQYFADHMNVTKEVAFAFIESINDHDIEWLNGDYSSMFDVLTPETLEGRIYSTTQAISDLNVKLATGKISAQDYRAAYYGLSAQVQDGTMTTEECTARVQTLNEQLANGTITASEYNRQVWGLAYTEETLAKQARSEAQAWSEKTTKLEEYKVELQECYEQLASGKDADGNIVDAEEVQAKVEEITGYINTLTDELTDLNEPTELTLQVAMDSVTDEINALKQELEQEKVDLEKAIAIDAEGKFYVTTAFEGNTKLETYVGLLNEQHSLEVQMGAETPDVISTLQSVNETLSNIQKILEAKYNLTVDTSGAVTSTSTFKNMWDSISNKSVTLWATVKEKIGSFFNGADVNGTAHVHGTAFAGGSWGASKTETALTGELGPEILVRNGRWTTVGENGAEFTQVKKGDIIFNHKQSEQLLTNGYITSRGKAYASGTAYAPGATIWPYGSSQTQWEGTGYSSWDDPTYDASEALSDALSDAADSVNEFEETIDWIEVRMEELDEVLSRYSAKLENASTYDTNSASKNDIINEMIKINQDIRANALAGAKYYENYAEKYLVGMNDELIAAAKNGAIAITEFMKEQDEATVEAIQNYRDYIQKAADLYTQAEEAITAIRDLAIQSIDNIKDYGSAKTSIEDAQTEKLQNRVDLDEERGLVTSPEYYTAMMENSGKKIEYWTPVLQDMQNQFDEAVRSGRIEVGSVEWYEQLEKLYDVQAEIDQAKIELEEFQNAINDIYWDNFENLTNQIEYLEAETQSLIDLMENRGDMVSTPENAEFWGADDVQWTKEGLTSLGLYAQQMEIAEFKSRQYAAAIDDLQNAYKAGKYSESEYKEKLNELTSAQYDAINSYYEAQDAIVDLNKTRVDAIKNGIEKEIDAYSELIDKKKEELSAEKDLYDFQKSTMQQQKNIADIERKLAALANDHSMSAVAQRKRLEADLAEAQYELQDTYYNRSVEDKQTALDKELSSFQTEKEAEIAKWEEYLTNVELVIAESLGIVQTKASEIGQTLTGAAQEYNLTVASAILTPWQDGAWAISGYQTAFDTATSSTTTTLESIRAGWQAIIDKMVEASKVDISNINAENSAYAAATPAPAAPAATPAPAAPAPAQPSLANGSSVTIKTSATHFGSKSGGARMASFVPGGTYTVYQTSGDQVLIGRNGVYTGWVKKTDIQGFAKGTLSANKDQIAWIDELGEELQFIPGQNGRLEFVKKGTGIVPADLTERLIGLAMNPQEVLDRNRPAMMPSKSVVNNEMQLSVDASVGTLIHVEHLDGNNPDEVVKLVNKTWDKKMQGLNNALKKFTR